MLYGFYAGPCSIRYDHPMCGFAHESYYQMAEIFYLSFGVLFLFLVKNIVISIRNHKKSICGKRIILGEDSISGPDDSRIPKEVSIYHNEVLKVEFIRLGQYKIKHLKIESSSKVILVNIILMSAKHYEILVANFLETLDVKMYPIDKDFRKNEDYKAVIRKLENRILLPIVVIFFLSFIFLVLNLP